MEIIIIIFSLAIVIGVILGIVRDPNRQNSQSENLKDDVETRRKNLEDIEQERLEDLYDEYWDDYL